MIIKQTNKPFIVFDLDDTLFQEINFLKSAYRHIELLLKPYLQENLADQMYLEYTKGNNAFKWLLERYKEQLPSNVDLNFLLHEYRTHHPTIELNRDAAMFIKSLQRYSIPLGLITDGRSITQRNKLTALGIQNIFETMVISEEFGSEKPNPANYLHFENLFPSSEFYYFGDNTKKDFIAPLALGWKTICVKNKGENIHNQDLTLLSPETLIINSFEEIAFL
ncbi:MAG: HAD family hydrolase [Chitinophagaceae bacterium]|nr:HAD family hydrolase [Chitinophagaceae bacterium]